MRAELYIALLPVILLLLFIYKKDIDKEPRGTLIRVFLFGLLSAIPAAIIEVILGDYFYSTNIPSFWMTLLVVFTTVAIVEELGKWIATYLCTYRRKEFNHMYDGIVYAVFASLGFAAIENILYIFKMGIGTGLLRAVLAVPGHAVDGVFMGIFLSLSKRELVNKNNKKSLCYLVLSILVPAISHAIYDGLIFYNEFAEDDMLVVCFFAFVIVSYIFAVIAISYFSKVQKNFDGTEAGKSPFQPSRPAKPVAPVKKNVLPSQTQCFYCGAPVADGKCTICGREKR